MVTGMTKSQVPAATFGWDSYPFPFASNILFEVKGDPGETLRVTHPDVIGVELPLSQDGHLQVYEFDLEVDGLRSTLIVGSFKTAYYLQKGDGTKSSSTFPLRMFDGRRFEAVVVNNVHVARAEAAAA